MCSAQIHKLIDQMITFFRLIGIWHREVRPTITQVRWKLFYSYPLFLISLSIGAFVQESLDERVVLAALSVIATVLATKLWMLLWKQKQIVQMLNRICVFSIRRDEEFAYFNEKMEKFIKFLKVFACATIIASLGCAVFPFHGNNKTLIVDIAFPLDRKNSEIGFWMAHMFLTTEIVLAFPALAFSAIIWCLLLVCSLRYKILGSDIRNLGRTSNKDEIKVSEKGKRIIFHKDLVASIKDHLHLRELIDELGSFLSKLFLLQFATSAICICGSIYCLAFDNSANFLKHIFHGYSLFYNLAELFMITYLGNEIMLSSDALTYSLFECDWIDQPHSTKKCIIVFGEYLKQSHQILIGKLYPLTLETFTRILKSSYSFFNILKNTKK